MVLVAPHTQLSVCVCVCVCVREREREREGGREGVRESTKKRGFFCSGLL